MINQLPFPSFFLTVVLLVAGFVFFMVYIMVYHTKKAQQYREATKQLKHDHELSIVHQRVQVQEEVLDKVGSALHDTLGQQLHILKLQVELMSKHTVQSNTANLIDMHAVLLDDIIRQVRELSHLLMNKELKASGFLIQLEQEIIQLNVTTSLNCSLRVTGTYQQLNQQVEGLLYKVWKECVQNTIKHAKATQLNCSLIINADALILEIKDNGKGWNTGALSTLNKGKGIASMKLAAAAIGAQLVLKSAPGQGLKVALSIPIAKHTQQNVA